MAQVVEHLPSKLKALICTTKPNQNKTNQNKATKPSIINF
jgi:hypothetical protein